MLASIALENQKMFFFAWRNLYPLGDSADDLYGAAKMHEVKVRPDAKPLVLKIVIDQIK